MAAIDEKLAAEAARGGRPTASAVDDVLGSTDLSVEDIVPKRPGAARYRHA